MKRERRWTWRIVLTMGIAVLVVMGLWLLGPTIIQRIIVAKVEGLGLPKPSLRIGGNSLSHLEIVHLSVGQDDRLCIGSLGIDYSVWQLLHKRIDSIEIVGLDAEIRRKDGVWDLGPLAGLHGPTGSETPAEMPFRRIMLRASTLVLDLDGRHLRIPISGSVENTGSEALALNLTAVVEGVTLQLVGTFNTKSHDFTLNLAGDVPDLAHVLTVLAPSITPITISAGDRDHRETRVSPFGHRRHLGRDRQSIHWQFPDQRHQRKLWAQVWRSPLDRRRT